VYDDLVRAALPIDPYVPSILESLQRHRAAVVVAAPGAGKTTRVPPALAAAGPVILLQPRRVAARSIARRIADEQRWTLGREVGWHVRFDRRFGADTSLLVATEGILTARLQQDPLLSDFQTVVLDEFHERSIHADLGIALAKQAWLARHDLRILVMSATLDAGRVAEYLGNCPVVDVPGRLHPLEIDYRPGHSVAGATREALARSQGNVLGFLPGAGEVRRAAQEVRAVADTEVDVLELHGSLAPEDQDRALVTAPRRRVIVATNIAQTSLTVPGIHAVIDTGQHKVARYDAARGVDSLELEKIPRDAADQRAGRAGRLGPGLVLRLWHEHDRLRPHDEPEIARVDLAGPALGLLAWGADPHAFDWFEPPRPDALDAALELLSVLGATSAGRITPLGRQMARLPLHPRLARILLAGGGGRAAAAACALLSDRQALPRHPATTTCDLLEAMDHDLPPHVERVARELQREAGATAGAASEIELRKALFAGYPDRIGRRRSPGDPRVLLATGYGAVIGPESGVREGEFVLALDVQGGRRGERSEARIRIASIVDRAWLMPTSVEEAHELDAGGTVRARRREKYGELLLREIDERADPVVAATTLADAFVRQPLRSDDEQLMRRLRFAGVEVDIAGLALRAAAGRTRLSDVHLLDGLEWGARQKLSGAAPTHFTAPSGRAHPIEYREDGTLAVAIKLQELFGLASTPRIGPRREPLLFLLLAPSGRPVQTTRDLASFWNTTYPEVRRELRGRYPKHPWPEDPWAAVPTARTLKRAKR
jgi:ATP-dependent helicase HrpB